MWLLSTDRAELKYFNDPLDVPLGFAILSHRWDDTEQSFDEVQALAAQCKSFGTNPRDFVSAKIRESCKLAQSHGQLWIWIDTCCIDKRSSVELSEAINSMFRYYSLSVVCYAYLRDVPPRSNSLCEFDYLWDDRSESWKGRFQNSVWHKRAWTLQELVAPRHLVFIASDWTILGTKVEHSALLSHVTHISPDVLCFKKDISEISLYERMSWASPRSATKVEDEAYSLMGIFGVNMPVLYGEGRRAFYRLQEEILKTSTDASLFAWGEWDWLDDGMPMNRLPYQLSLTHDDSHSYLLAPSPDRFQATRQSVLTHAGTFVSSSSRPNDASTADDSSDSEEGAGRLEFTMTPYGMRARVPILDIPDEDFKLAFLFCNHKSHPLALYLLPCRGPRANFSPPLYQCGQEYHADIRAKTRVSTSPGDIRHTRPQWRTVYITAYPPFRAADLPDGGSSSLQVARALANLATCGDPPFRIDVADVIKLADGRLKLHATPKTTLHWPGSPYVLLFHATSCDPVRNALAWPPRPSHVMFSMVALAFGMCTSGGSAEHWARVRTFETERVMDLDVVQRQCEEEAAKGHSCPEDHITRWTQPELITPALQPPRRLGRSIWTSSFQTKRDRMHFSFSVCPFDKSGKTLVLHVRTTETLETQEIPPNESEDVLEITPVQHFATFQRLWQWDK